MFKQCRILDKETNEIFFGEIDTEFEGNDFYSLIEIPDDGNNYIFQDGEAVIKENQPNQETINLEARRFLYDTDWKVIRHRDQLDLGIETSLTNEEFQELLMQRQEARERVMEEL